MAIIILEYDTAAITRTLQRPYGVDLNHSLQQQWPSDEVKLVKREVTL